MQEKSELLETNIPIWIEFEQKTGRDLKNIFLIHISFPTEKEARELFPIMTKEWLLPLTLKENRVIISSDVIEIKSVAGQCFRINFDKNSDAKNFFDFIELARKNWDKSIPNIDTCFVDHFVYLGGFLHPYYSIANRKSAHDQLVNRCIFKLLELNNLGFLPEDLSLLIAMYIYNLSASDISKQFKVPQDLFEQPYQKIDCDIKYSHFNQIDDGGNPQYKVHLICSNDNDAAILAKNLEKSGIKLRYFQKKNEIVVKPLYCGHKKFKEIIKANSGTFSTLSKNTGETIIGIKFKKPDEAATFNSFVNFKKNEFAIVKDSLCFQVSGSELYDHHVYFLPCLY